MLPQYLRKWDRKFWPIGHRSGVGSLQCCTPSIKSSWSPNLCITALWGRRESLVWHWLGASSSSLLNLVTWWCFFLSFCKVLSSFLGPKFEGLIWTLQKYKAWKPTIPHSIKKAHSGKQNTGRFLTLIPALALICWWSRDHLHLSEVQLPRLWNRNNDTQTPYFRGLRGTETVSDLLCHVFYKMLVIEWC